MIVSFDKNHKLRLTYDGRSYIIHNHDNHYYINKDDEKIYCTNEVKKFYKNSSLTKHHKNINPIIHTLQMFEINGHKYVVEKYNNNYCVHKNGMYLCNNEVQQLVKQIYGGVPVNLENSYTRNDNSFERGSYDDRKEFIDQLEINISKHTGSLLRSAIVYNGNRIYFPMIYSKRDIINFKIDKILNSGSFGITGLMKSIDPLIKKKFVIKTFKDYTSSSFIFACYKNELEIINDLNIKNLFPESTYARVVDLPSPFSGSYVLMELAEGDLYNFYSLNKSYLIDSPCNSVKLVYGIFHEVYNMFNNSGYLHADIKLENFLYTHEKGIKGNKVFHVIMADYGSLGKYNQQVGILKNSVITYSGIALTYRKFGALDWFNNWENVAYSLGCTILNCLGINHFSYVYESPSILLNDAEDIFNKLVGMPNERKLIASLLGINIINDSTPSVSYELAKDDDILNGPEKIKEAFKQYKITQGCDLLEIEPAINKRPSIFSCIGKLCGSNKSMYSVL